MDYVNRDTNSIENYLSFLCILIHSTGNDGKTTLLMFLVKLVDEEVLDLEDVANGCTDGSKVTFKQVDETLGTARLGCIFIFFLSHVFLVCFTVHVSL